MIRRALQLVLVVGLLAIHRWTFAQGKGGGARSGGARPGVSARGSGPTVPSARSAAPRSSGMPRVSATPRLSGPTVPSRGASATSRGPAIAPRTSSIPSRDSSGLRAPTMTLPNADELHDHGRVLHDHATDRYFVQRGNSLREVGTPYNYRSRVIYIRPYYDPFYWRDPYYFGYGFGLGYGGFGPGFGFGYRTGFGYDYYSTVPGLVLGYRRLPRNVVPEPSQVTDDRLPAEQLGVLAGRAFHDGEYESAEKWLRHAVTKDARDGRLWMMLGQSLFARGQFNDAAGAVQNGMTLLPPEQWGTVIENYRDFYATPTDYATQLKALEKAIADQLFEPGPRFLLAFHYAYLGYPAESIREVNELMKLAPNDTLAIKLRELMSAKLPMKIADPNIAPPPQ